MAQLFEIKKVTVGPKNLDAIVELAPNAPVMTNEDLEGTTRVWQVMPELRDHVCLGDESGNFGEVMGATELAHLLEHVTVELLARTDVAGDISCGQTTEVGEREYKLTFKCVDDVLVVGALSSAAWVMQWAFSGGGEPRPDADAIASGLAALLQSLPEVEERDEDEIIGGPEPVEVAEPEDEQVVAAEEAVSVEAVAEVAPAAEAAPVVEEASAAEVVPVAEPAPAAPVIDESEVEAILAAEPVAYEQVAEPAAEEEAVPVEAYENAPVEESVEEVVEEAAFAEVVEPEANDEVDAEEVAAEAEAAESEVTPVVVEPEPVAAPQPEPVAEPVVEPAAEPEAVAEPEPAAAPQLEPAPAPEPVAAPAVAPEPASAPEPAAPVDDWGMENVPRPRLVR